MNINTLKHFWIYDPNTGHFTNRISRGRAKAGKRAGAIRRGYRVIGFQGRQYPEHHLAWLWVHGHLPKRLDHINRNGLDNRIANLRPATANENAWNAAWAKRNPTGYKGVYWNQKGANYRAMIRAYGKSYHVGHFSTALDAAKARQAFGRALHRKFYCED